MSIQWKGVMPAVTTKFTADDKLDFRMFEVNVKAQFRRREKRIGKRYCEHG
jgi:dihydrodipicolinate synthase/N-acetylneuraminate lyase